MPDIYTHCGCFYSSKYYRLVGTQLQVKSIQFTLRHGILSPTTIWKPLREVTLRG